MVISCFYHFFCHYYLAFLYTGEHLLLFIFFQILLWPWEFDGDGGGGGDINEMCYNPLLSIF